MSDLATRESLFRSQLDPTLSVEETEEEVLNYLRNLPEARQENTAVLRGQLVAAQDALLKAEEAALFLGWPSMVEDMGGMRATLGLMRKVVGG